MRNLLVHKLAPLLPSENMIKLLPLVKQGVKDNTNSKKKESCDNLKEKKEDTLYEEIDFTKMQDSYEEEKKTKQMDECSLNSKNQDVILEKKQQKYRDDINHDKTEVLEEKKKEEESGEEGANVHKSEDIMNDRERVQNIVKNKAGDTPMQNDKKAIKDQGIERITVCDTMENLDDDDAYDENDFDMSNFQDKELIFFPIDDEKMICQFDDFNYLKRGQIIIHVMNQK